MSEMSLRGVRLSFPATITHSCASKYKLAPWHKIWTNNCPWLADYIWTEHDTLVSCILLCMCRSRLRAELVKNLSSVHGAVNTVGCYGLMWQTGLPLVSTQQQVQGCGNFCPFTVAHSSLHNLRLQSLIWPLEQGSRDRF